LASRCRSVTLRTRCGDGSMCDAAIPNCVSDMGGTSRAQPARWRYRRYTAPRTNPHCVCCVLLQLHPALRASKRHRSECDRPQTKSQAATLPCASIIPSPTDGLVSLCEGQLARVCLWRDRELGLQLGCAIQLILLSLSDRREISRNH
jgi:hypothetical protein